MTKRKRYDALAALDSGAFQLGCQRRSRYRHYARYLRNNVRNIRTHSAIAILLRPRAANDRWSALVFQVALVALVLAPTEAYAQAVPAGAGMTLIQAIQASVAGWAGPMRTVAQDILAGLGVISLVYSVGFTTLNGGGMTDVMGVVVRTVAWLGLVAFIIQGFPAFGNAVIASFQQLAQQAGAVPSSPTDVMAMGTDVGIRIMKSGSILHPLVAGSLIIAAAFAAIGFYIAAALMLFSLAKAYVVVAMGTVFIGFAGHEFTMPHARGVLSATLGAGARLMSIQLLAGIGATLVRGWIGETTVFDDASVITTIGLAVIYAVIIFMVPAAVEGMANGHGGHGRSGPGEMMRVLAQNTAAMTSMSRALSNLGSAGQSMMNALPGRSSNTNSSGNNTLPAPSGSAPFSTPTAGVGQRMRQSNASVRPRS
jgi:P-type conjugative transfer protein TrbL